MVDIVLDTNVLADFLAQFFGFAQRGTARFVAQNTISRELAHKLNQIVRWYDDRWHQQEEIEEPESRTGADGKKRAVKKTQTKAPKTKKAGKPQRPCCPHCGGLL